jgi:hypothetical protein
MMQLQTMLKPIDPFFVGINALVLEHSTIGLLSKPQQQVYLPQLGP